MFSLSHIADKLIMVTMENFSVYFAGHLPVAFKVGRDVKIRDADSPVTNSQIQQIMMIETYSGRNTIVEMDQPGFAYALNEQYKKAMYNVVEKLTLKRMGIDDDSEISDTCKLRNISIGSLDERPTGD